MNDVFDGVPQDGADGAELLTRVHDWLGTYISTVSDSDLDLLTLWAVHTHLVMETYTTPRLQVDSPVPESGKTTVIEHLERLCKRSVQMATISSPAMLTRMLDKELRTILIDEADRALDPKKEGMADVLAVINSGYKRGGTRPVLVPEKGAAGMSRKCRRSHLSHWQVTTPHSPTTHGHALSVCSLCPTGADLSRSPTGRRLRTTPVRCMT